VARTAHRAAQHVDRRCRQPHPNAPSRAADGDRGRHRGQARRRPVGVVAGLGRPHRPDRRDRCEHVVGCEPGEGRRTASPVPVRRRRHRPDRRRPSPSPSGNPGDGVAPLDGSRHRRLRSCGSTDDLPVVHRHRKDAVRLGGRAVGGGGPGGTDFTRRRLRRHSDCVLRRHPSRRSR
jgi:hypothetical protein